MMPDVSFSVSIKSRVQEKEGGFSSFRRLRFLPFLRLSFVDWDTVGEQAW